MQQINEDRLETDLGYRFEYVSQFIGFGEADIQAIHNSAEHLAPLVPQLVDAVYEKLFSYDSTKRHFVPRQSGYDGDVPMTIDDLHVDHEMIQFRKNHLGRYLVKLVSAAYDAELLKYLDKVGAIHTPKAGSESLDIPLVQMIALLGFVSHAVLSTIASLGLERETEFKTIAAFNKLLWIQNDLINRHYA
jgi:hypothetical protein